ncbi:MotA/TolQ/ExbB proton channel family protein [compost metagenome]
MILTFQTITLFGTGDPKIMAGNISLALVTTALGLIAALPLILVHSMIMAKAKAILGKLDEQSVGLIAAIAEKESV